MASKSGKTDKATKTAKESAPKPPAEPPFTFIFKDKYESTKREGEEPGPFFVCYVKEKGEKEQNHLCDITEHRFYENPTCSISGGNSFESLDHTYVGNIKFPSKELAASFYYNFCKKVKQRIETAPLPNLVTSYIRSRADDLKKEENFLLSRFEELRYEWVYILKMIKDYGLKRVIRPYTVTDGVKMVKDLYSIKVDVKGEKEPIPFFSESALYELVGKDTARSILAAVRDVARALAPNGRIEDCLGDDDEDE